MSTVTVTNGYLSSGHSVTVNTGSSVITSKCSFWGRSAWRGATTSDSRRLGGTVLWSTRRVRINSRQEGSTFKHICLLSQLYVFRTRLGMKAAALFDGEGMWRARSSRASAQSGAAPPRDLATLRWTLCPVQQRNGRRRIALAVISTATSTCCRFPCGIFFARLCSGPSFSRSYEAAVASPGVLVLRERAQAELESGEWCLC